MELVIIDFLQKIYDILSVYMLPALGTALVLTFFRLGITKEKRGLVSFFLWVTFVGLIIGETVIRRLGTVKETADIWGFEELLQDPWFVVAAIENVVMFLPYGFLFVLAFRAGKKVFLQCSIVNVLLCMGIEITQFVLVIGEAEVLDVLCNLCGAWIGYAMGSAILILVKKCNDKGKKDET